MLAKTFSKIYTYSKVAYLRTVTTSTPNILPSEKQVALLNPTTIDENVFKETNHSMLDPVEDSDEISHIAPYLKPTFNFAAYVNKSETLQELLKLGVNLHKLEHGKGVPKFIMGLDFETAVKPYVIFFHGLGLDTGAIGEIITKNPFILRQDLDHLGVRVNYLRFKKFDDAMIQRIIEKNPFWLSYSTQAIDEKLGFFQKYFSLTGDETRHIAVRTPTLITWNIKNIKLNTFVLKEEMGFPKEDIKKIILKKPKILIENQVKLIKSFEYLHNVMNISLEMIAEFPEALTFREKRLRERHLFLDKLGKAQYNPKLENYVGLLALASGEDGYFATEVAKSSVQAYNAYLKTM